MKTKMFVDFDGTLFNTDKFKDGIWKILKKAGYSAEEILETYRAECRDYKFDLDGQLTRLREIRKFDDEMVNQSIALLFHSASNYLYADAIPFLINIDRNLYEVILFSLGAPAFQKKKVDATSITKYFDHCFYTTIQKWESLTEHVGIKDRFVLIDDRNDTVHHVAEKFERAVTIEISHKDEDLDDPKRIMGNYKNITIKTLDEANKYLNQ